MAKHGERLNVRKDGRSRIKRKKRTGGREVVVVRLIACDRRISYDEGG